jgi:hypothetical protein
MAVRAAVEKLLPSVFERRDNDTHIKTSTSPKRYWFFYAAEKLITVHKAEGSYNENSSDTRCGGHGTVP